MLKNTSSHSLTPFCKVGWQDYKKIGEDQEAVFIFIFKC